MPGWARVPHGIWLREATAVAVDSSDRVYVFSRGNMPMVVFDRDGNVIDMWGNDSPFGGVIESNDPYGNKYFAWGGPRFRRQHAITIDSDDNLWLVDDIGCKIYKTDRKGKVLLEIGTGIPAPRQSGQMFNKPTDIAVSPVNGDLFISDGYGNSRVHHLDKRGRHIKSWGEPGTDPGQFSLPHNIAMFGDDHVIVCDRENHRVQVFTLDGDFVKEWHVHKATAVYAGKGRDTNVYIGEQGPPAVQFGVRNLGHRVSIYGRDGKLRTRLGAALPGEGPDQFLWPHSVTVDSHGDIYVAEVSYVEVGRHQNPPREMASLRKWRRASG